MQARFNTLFEKPSKRHNTTLSNIDSNINCTVSSPHPNNIYKNTCNPSKKVYNTRQRKLGRAVECTGLENRRGFVAHREFESLSFRHFFTFPYWKLGRAVECTGLENRRGFVAHREFESLSFRHS